MDNNNNNPTEGSGQGNNFFSGFLLGALVGAAVVFLLGTKKGKKLLKVISEEGIDNISNILDEETSLAQPSPLRRQSGYGASETRLRPAGKAMADKSEGQRREFAIKEKSVEEKPKVRRFFRGISRRVN